MKCRIVYRSLLVFISLVCVSLNYVASGSRKMDECSYQLKRAFVQDVLGEIGVHNLGTYFGIESFVYSDIQIVQHVVQLISIASPTLANYVKSFLSIRGENCVHQYCKKFNDIIRGIKASMGGNLRYESALYYDSGKKVHHWYGECGTMREVNYTDLPSVKARLIADFGNFSGSERQCIKKDFHYSDYGSLYLYSALNVNPAIFGDVKYYGLGKMFRDLDGKYHDVEWLYTSTDVWSVTTELLPAISHGEILCEVEVLRTDINGGRQYMIYFMPRHHITDHRYKQRYCFKEILYNLRIYVDQTIDKTIYRTNNHKTDFNELLFPVMDITTETDLWDIFYQIFFGITRLEEIKHLYREKVSLDDLRTCDRFYNNRSDYQKVTPDISKVLLLHSPFVFTMVDKETKIIIKTGAYFKPKCN